jgi:hypothetical protein
MSLSFFNVVFNVSLGRQQGSENRQHEHREIKQLKVVAKYIKKGVESYTHMKQ